MLSYDVSCACLPKKCVKAKYELSMFVIQIQNLDNIMNNILYEKRRNKHEDSIANQHPCLTTLQIITLK